MLTIMLLVLLQGAQAQRNGFRTLYRFPAEAADARMDNLGNVYLITAEGSVTKRGPAGDSVAYFNAVRRFGGPFSIDVSNPLKVLLFYKDFAQVAVLDRFLAQQASIDLRRSGVQQPIAAGLSFDGKIWVFDALGNKLKKLDESGRTLFETPDLRAVFAGGLQPQQIWDQNNWVYLYDSLQGLFQFDYYGSFKRKIPIAGWRNLLITDKYVYGIKEGKACSYNRSNLMQEELALPQALQLCNIYFGRNKLVALCPGEVRVLTLE